MPLLMGIYLAFKIGDMLVRGTYVYLLDGTFQTNAFVVEVLFGVLLPFVLLLFRRVRRSAGWLFFASTVFVLGILMNRINVFVVSFTPPYMIQKYFPALGEIFITVGLAENTGMPYRNTSCGISGAPSPDPGEVFLLHPIYSFAGPYRVTPRSNKT